MFRVGIVGLGTVSTVHCKALREMDNVALAASCDCDETKRLPDTAFYTDYHEMARCADLDAVHICLPHDLHEDAATVFAENGVAVLCEKPVSISVESCRRMSDLQQRCGVTVAVCLQNRWNTTFETLQKCLAEDDCGSIRGIKAVATWSRDEAYYAAAPWRGKMSRSGGGCMINQAVHVLDQMLQLGGAVAQVKGNVMNLADYPIEVEDSAAAHIVFENGTTGLFFGSVCNIDNASIELQVTCEKATYTIKDYALWYNAAGQETEKQLIVRDRQMPDGKTYYGPSHVHLIRDFYRHLDGNGGRYVDVADGACVIGLIDSIRRSSQEHRPIMWKEIM